MKPFAREVPPPAVQAFRARGGAGPLRRTSIIGAPFELLDQPSLGEILNRKVVSRVYISDTRTIIPFP
jgi:hypothetical protein